MVGDLNPLRIRVTGSSEFYRIKVLFNEQISRGNEKAKIYLKKL